MAAFARDVLEAAGTEREVRFTTVGRRSGKPRSVTIWISTDGRRLFIRSGGGLMRQWPQNLMAIAEASLRIGGQQIKVRARHVTDPAEARAASGFVRQKYGSMVKPTKPGEPLSAGEQATFELLPAD